ncbi:javelin-like [Nomia melanderi]|uniref:javelin-like n=1 Tax=Nomia melanderi TaxID=2448451 RepID=UPI003FCCDD82
MSNDASSSRSDVSSFEASTTNLEEEFNSQASVDRDAKRPRLSVANSIAKKCGNGVGSAEGVIGSVSGGNGGSGGGMDCMPLRPGPFHYLISEQAKSLVALQELQNEVGALLEFRDLVMETFPNLRHKMAATASAGASVISSTCAQNSHIPLPLSSPSSRRINEWEPGKVRRRIPREGGESSSSSLPRSRSNSHSGGTKNNCSATVQDSGFSTETSSKDSASTAIAPRPNSPRPAILDEAEDELWNLLDVIHRKGIRLREEVECLQGRLESVAPEDLASTDILDAVKDIAFLGGDRTAGIDAEDGKEDNSQVIALRREKEQLLDKVAELEAETISSRARAQELQSELAALSALKSGLEDRLRAGLNDSSSDILTPGAQRLQPIAPVVSSPKSNNVSNIKSKSSAFASVATSAKAHKSRFRTRTIEKNVLLDVNAHNDELRDIDVEANVKERRARLGALDSVLVSPTRVAHVKDVDSKKIAAILREHSPLELQRHLITTTVHNQVLQKRLYEVQKSTETLSGRLDKAREENDDLRFQLEERNIELEGTRARVRVLERLQQRPPTEIDPDVDADQPRCEQAGLEPGSSTESARDHHQAVEVKPSPRRRPSRIPLPGLTSKATAPRPPSHGRNDSKESLKSLTRPPRDSSRDSHGGKSLSKARDSSRDSLGNKSLTKNSSNGSGGGSGGGGSNGNVNVNVNGNGNGNGNSKETNRESLNRSLPRNNSSRDSLNKSSSLSRARDSLESNNLGTSSSPGTTPPRRPPAPARRSYSLARASTSIESENGKRRSTDTCLKNDEPPDGPLPKCLIWSAGERAFEPVPGGPIKKMAPTRVPPVFLTCTEPPSSWCSTNGSFRHSDSSLYPDSLNQETSSMTGSTRVEFIIGSPTRRFRQSSVWPHRYFDSIDSTAMLPESLLTDEFSLNHGEALAECDSLDCQPLIFKALDG